MKFSEAAAIIGERQFTLAQVGSAKLVCQTSEGRLDLTMQSTIGGDGPKSIGFSLMFADLDDFELKLKLAINRAKGLR